MRGDVAEIGNAVSIARNAIAIVADGEIVFAVLPTTRDRDLSRVRVDAVLDKLGNSFQRVALRQGDDPDCVPVIADSQLTLRFRSTYGGALKVSENEEFKRIISNPLPVKSTARVNPSSVTSEVCSEFDTSLLFAYKYHSASGVTRDAESGNLPLETARCLDQSGRCAGDQSPERKISTELSAA